MPIVALEDLPEIFKKKRWARSLAGVAFRVFRLHALNRLYDKHSTCQGLDFIDALLDELRIQVKVDIQAGVVIPPGGFVVMANHPFGLLDGLVLLKVIGAYHPQVKLVVHSGLKKATPLQDNLLFANTRSHRNQKTNLRNAARLKAALTEGSAVILFPAGLVSHYTSGQITDPSWNATAAKLAARAQAPVLPVYVHGRNSLFFHLLQLISPKLGFMRLPSEFFRKRNKTIRISIGAPLYLDARDPEAEILRVREAVYALRNNT